MSLSNPFYLDSLEKIRNIQQAQSLPLSSSTFPSFRNNFWWVGNLGIVGGITANKNAHDWNNANNWVVWDESGQAGTPFIPASRVPGSLTASSDIVNIGGYNFGPTAYAPLLFGGFSGSSTTGHYANGVGASFAPGTTLNNLISEVNIKWEYGAELKYPWTLVGGGIDPLTSLGVTAGSQTGCSAAPGVTFGEYYNDPRYRNLSLKTRNTNEESSRANNKNVYLNFIKAIVTEYIPEAGAEITQPVGSFYKGTGGWGTGWGNSWNTGSSSRSKVWLTGFIPQVIDQSRPSEQYVTNISRSLPAQIKTDYGTTSEGMYGYPAIYLGFGDKGCTVGVYQGYNLCPISVNNNSSVGYMFNETLFSYVSRTGTVNSLVGLPLYTLLVSGEVDVRKSLISLGFTAGQIEGLTGGLLNVNTTPYILTIPQGFGGNATGLTNSGPVNIAVGNPQFGSPSVTGVGWTGTSRIVTIAIDNSAFESGRLLESSRGEATNLLLYGGLTSERISVVNTKISPYPEATSSLFDIGALEMFWYSELQFNSAPNINNWKFGVIPFAGKTGPVTGGIFGDDTSIIKMSSGVSLYNKSLNRTLSSRFSKFTAATELLNPQISAPLL